MHTRAIHTEFRLWHKGSMKTMTLCDRFDSQLEGHDIIRSRQCFIILEINLMLRRCYLMMGGFYDKSHILQCQDHISSCILAKIQRS